MHRRQINPEEEKKTKDSLNWAFLYPSCELFSCEKNNRREIYLVIFIKIPANPIPVDIAIMQSKGKKLTIPYNETIQVAFARPIEIIRIELN